MRLVLEEICKVSLRYAEGLTLASVNKLDTLTKDLTT